MSWEDILNWGRSLFGSSGAPENAIGQNIDGSYILGPSKPSIDSSSLWDLFGGSKDSKDSTSNIWGPLITAGGGLAQSYMAANQQGQTNDINVQQAEAQRQWLDGQAEKQRAAAAAAQAATIAAQKKIAQMNNMASLYQTWGQLNQRAGEAMGESALQTGRNASGAIMARAAGIR